MSARRVNNVITQQDAYQPPIGFTRTRDPERIRGCWSTRERRRIASSMPAMTPSPGMKAHERTAQQRPVFTIRLKRIRLKRMVCT